MPEIEFPEVTRAEEFRPPQFNREDVEVWRRWRPVLEKRYEKIEYNVRVGGTKPSALEEPIYAEMWEKISARRIDCVGHARDHIALIEFRAFAGPSAIGQLLMYKTLYLRDFVVEKPIKLILVTDILREDILMAALGAGIEIEVVTRT